MSLVREYIIQTTEQYYGNSKLELDTKAEEILANFINSEHILLLQGFLHNDNCMQFYTQIHNDKKKSIIFYKSSARELSGDDALRQINIITMSTEPAVSLYQILKQIYSPLLSASDDLYSNKLQKNLSELESNLRILTHGKSGDNANVILSIEDEVDYWKMVEKKKDSNKKEKEVAFTFRELFEDVCEEIKTLQSASMSETREAAENIGGILDDVWRSTLLPYSQERMTHIFDIIGHIICSAIQRGLSTVEVDLWKVDGDTKDASLLTLLSMALKVIQTWTSACQSLTETYWPNYVLHAWTGRPYSSRYCGNFQSRLKEIYDVRSTHNQLNKLLSSSEKEELKTRELLEPFRNINVWICNGSNLAWESAMSRFAGNLRPAESKIADKLRSRLHNTSTKQMLYEFMRYKTLLDRPAVKRELNTELEVFVTSLGALLRSVRAQLDADDLDVNMHTPPEMSPVVHQVQWAKQMEAKIKEIAVCAEKYLNEFEGSAELLKMSTEVLKELKALYTQLHEEWSRDIQAQVKKGSLQLQLDRSVVEFSNETRMMVVQFNPRLVWCELEARALSALGLPAPPHAAHAIDTLAPALGHARALQQVASFHNTLGERMIPSTRPMMLQTALDLSALVQDQKAVYWNDIEQLTKYTDKLKTIVMKLESQNTYLTSQHMAIRAIVEQLLDTELLAKQSEWKKKIKDILVIIEKVEANGYKNTELWRSHWDWQLYKALECQYIKTLLSLHKHFPMVKVDLVLRGRVVRAAPPLEEVRAQHYHQLRRLVAAPAQLQALQHNIEQKPFFADIVDKHSWLGNKAVKQLEAALSALERTCEDWTRRAALACVADLEALCTEHLQEPKDWEENFKACKAYGQAVATMAFEDEKIEWIIVGTATLRREFEAQARSLWACLMMSLQASCRHDVGALDTFVANALVMIEDKAMPKNAKELAEISAKQQALQANMPEMEKLVEGLKRKGYMLRMWGGDASVDGTVREWQRVRELILGHQQMFEHRAEIVKSSLKGDWENLNTNVEAWHSRWSQARQRLEETHDAKYDEMADRCRSVFEAQLQWNKFVTERDDLLKECEKFNMDVKLSDTWKESEKLITEYVNLWGVLKEYSEEYESIAGQEWIVYQKKLHLIDEFLSKWSAKLEPYTIVTLYMQQELDKFNDLPILLKYLRGADFTERHWREVYSLLGMEYKKPDTLLVKDFLDVAMNIKKQIKALQKISSAASSEAAVRSALTELEVWFAGARLSIIYYNDKAKRPTPIVKDFKDMLAKISEQQWVVSSVGGGDACAAWDARLQAARALLRAAHHAQRRWLYLEPILSNDEGDLGIKFRKVDLGFRQVTRILESDPRLSAVLQSSRLQSMLDSISEQLLACQSALNDYIDEKRSIFPRLYFLSDDDLLELLGQARAGADGREVVMQTHLKKLFPGITGVKLGPGGISVTALCSHYGETFQLDHPVDIDCPVETWLKNLETEMRASLKNMTLKCVVTNTLQEQDPFSLPTQILCLAQNIRFTEQAEKAITTKELHKLKTNIEKENLYYASTEADDESERHKRQALILQCAYYMSVIRNLIDNNVSSTNDWLWQKQLRFYLSSTKDVVAKMGLAQISYSYEYLGVNTGQFVRTELADDCFLILTQALHFGMVGNPFGPAGTGKTESVKALGGLVGRLVLIFNCDEALDAQCMGRLLTGLARCGAWGCFDELNRLTADTLAAVSHLLASLLQAMKNPGTAATLNGKQVTVSEWCGVAATMNPVGRGYGGRRTLPATLERLLRPIAMTQPRGDQLARHLLAARCITDADSIAEDLHTVFDMANTLLSGQKHYDWGLRALKATVGSCGAGLSARSDTITAKKALRRALRLNTVSKLTSHDAQGFDNILSMVFGNVPEESCSSDPLIPAVEGAIKTLGLVHNGLQVQKCVELYEQMQQRMGVVVVGPPGSGKTTIRRILKNALVQQGKSIVEYTISPKAMSRSWLLGHIDQDTRQWTNGVISTTALEISNHAPEVWSWVVCDGDIDPEWIEALNSVLDDNRLLTLPSGWRIQFGANVNFLFETHSLEHASPATVSRMGIILLSDDCTCANEVLENWVLRAEFESEITKMALPLLESTIKQCIHWLAVHRSDVILPLYSITMVQQILTQFEYVSENVGVSVVRSSPEELVYLSLQRSIMGLIKDSVLPGFQEEVCVRLGPAPVSMSCGEWVSDTLLVSGRLAAREPCVRASAASDQHLLVLGPHACAKNLLAEYVLKESNSTVITIDCTPILEPPDINAELKRNNVVRSGGSGSRGTARVTLLVRSLHRARVDAWGSSAVHSFLLLGGGFWERAAGSEDDGGMQWCACAPVRLVATARDAQLTAPRLAAACASMWIPEPDDEELLELAKHHLRNSLDSRSISEKEVSELAGKMLSLYKDASETFTSRKHYQWNASHLRRCCENIKWYSPSNAADAALALNAEATAIFRDRLVTDEEKAAFETMSRNHLRHHSEATYFIPKLKSDGVYLEGVDHKIWYQMTQKLINQCLTEHEYNVFGDTGAEVCLELAVLCPAIARACNGGVCVCVGGAGAGRRAAAQLIAAALPAAIHQANHAQHFHAHFRNALSSAAEGTRTIMVIGESAANFDILAAIEAHCVQSAPEFTQQSQHNIKHNLGIVICLDKDQEDLSELMDKFPMLYNESHMVWLEQWTSDTLRQLPQLIVQRLVKENVSDDIKEQDLAIPAEHFETIYRSLDTDWMRSPCRYVNLVKSYYNIVCRKKTAVLQRQKMLSSGVEALRRARSEVATLQAEAATKEAELSDKQAKANQALDQIGATVRATTDKKEEMHALKKSIEVENQKLQIRKSEIEAELASVEPIIAAARAAVGDIRSESLSEVRSLRAPPDVVRDILEGVLRLMGIADTSWHSMKNFLSKRGVKEDIRCLDASQISPEAAQSVQRLLEKRGSSFEAATAKRASAACAPLAGWVRANLAYADALARVRPLQRQQTELHKNLRDAESQLEALSSGLATVDERVSSLKQQLGQYTRDAAAVELSLAAAATTIAAANTLIQHLHHEYTAWQVDLQNISKDIEHLNVQSLLAAAYIVYLPDMTQPQAMEYVNKWSALLGFEDPTFSLINFLSSTESQLKWDADGLPSDMSAVKNAILIDQILESNKCGFTPLILDPDGDAIAWLKKTLADVPCDFVSQHSDKLHTAVQYAVRLSRVLVVTEVDSVHELWSGLLSGTPVSGRLLLYSRDATLPLRLHPHHAARVACLHFTARLDGLTDQLVHYALQQQNPEVNEKSKEIKLKKANLQKQQHELQENLLRDLSSKSDILHDANLTASLNKIRATSSVISEALDAARGIELETRAACEAYAVSARRAAVLALAVKRLAAKRPLVALPVETILDVFVDAVRKAGDPKKMDNDEVVKYLTRRIIERVLLGLHKKDKYIVVLHLLKQVYEDVIPEKLWQVFIGALELSEDHVAMKELQNKYEWLPDYTLKKLTQIKAASEDMFERMSLNNEGLWKEFLDSGNLSALRVLKLETFETVVAVAAMRPDTLYRAIVNFVDQILGTGAMSGSGGVSGGARWGGRARPVLLLAAHAQDALAAAAHPANIHTVGVESGAAAWWSAVEGARAGGWLAINVGASPFTHELHAFIAAFTQRSNEDFNENFRLWILSEDRDIPPLISNACVNVILESPEGVKHNVVGTLSAWSGVRADARVVRTLACLALFHALAQERRAYIPQGWSRWYSWEWGEVSASSAAMLSCGATLRSAAAALTLALYSARVSAAADAGLLATLHRACLGEHSLANNYTPPGLSKPLPNDNNIQAYTSAFTALPDMDSPELLGLPANCRVAWEKNATADIITGLKELSDISVNKKQVGRTPLKSLLALWKKLMAGSPLVKADYDPEKAARTGGAWSWWRCVCVCEAREAARAARRLHRALAARARHTRHQPLHQVPDDWQVQWSGPSAADAYLVEFCHRAAAAHARITSLTVDGDMPQAVDARSLLVVARVLSALRTRTAAARACPPAALALHAVWDPQQQQQQDDSSVLVTGLSLCGAEWRAGRLHAARPRAPPSSPAPPLLLSYVAHDTHDAGDSLSVPVWSDWCRSAEVCRARAPLAPAFPRHAAALNAVALVVAPASHDTQR